MPSVCACNSGSSKAHQSWAGNTNWSCHRHVASDRSRSRTIARISVSAARVAVRWRLGPDTLAPQKYNVYVTYCSWNTAINAHGDDTGLVESVAQLVSCLPAAFGQLLRLPHVYSVTIFALHTHMCVCVRAYNLFYLAFIFYAHAKVKSFLCKYVSTAYAKKRSTFCICCGCI